MRRAEAPGIVAKCLDLLALGEDAKGGDHDESEEDENAVLPEEYLEVLQVIRYESGQWNKPHHDGPGGAHTTPCIMRLKY